MQVLSSKDFKKKMKKHRPKVVSLFLTKLKLYIDDPSNQILRVHDLKGEYEGCKSFNVSGDFRAIFKLLDSQTLYFIDIDSHSNLYE